ncbi:hypothetical protein PoB_002729300 [Plakobranchus ocellatus]|uniref:Arrestin-like N-terminal domain-containing protein n=1 Tax=Plakobranchus ocellatus TaxID=259542 RepID=A0AAV4A0V9_9GAST|nr:hypothetical protein PoB_002729300 [Plakobranchus ocellatus]
MVEELSGVALARRIKVRWGEDKIQTDTVVLTFDSPKPPSRIRAGYLTLDVRCAAISANAMATARTGVRNLLLYALDVARVVMSNVTVRLTPIVSTAKETIQRAARPVRSSWKNKPFFATKLRMALPEGLRLPYGVPSFPLQIPIPLQIPPPAPGGETPGSSAFPFASLPLYPRSPCDGRGKAYKKD